MRETDMSLPRPTRFLHIAEHAPGADLGDNDKTAVEPLARATVRAVGVHLHDAARLELPAGLLIITCLHDNVRNGLGGFAERRVGLLRVFAEPFQLSVCRRHGRARISHGSSLPA